MHGDKVVAPVGFVAKRPDDDRRMILVPLEHGVAAIQHVIPPLRLAARDIALIKPFLPVFPRTVRLQIGFVNDV
ncbi:hypothetical protein D3C77_473320 [compost metagenome]